MVNRRNPEGLVTRDLLGELSKVATTTTTSTIHRQNFDFKSKSNRKGSNSPISSRQKQARKEVLNCHQDSSNLTPLKLLDPTHCSLEFKLRALSSSSSVFLASNGHNSYYNNIQSVCTLDMVKDALERATKPIRKEPVQKKIEGDEVLTLDGEEEGKKHGGSFVASCRVCLSYIITIKSNPKCPRCNSFVPSPFDVSEKPKIDINRL